MKLSWFITSVGTYKLYLAYKYVQYKAMQDKRDRVERYEIKHKQQDMFRDSSHCSTFPPSHRRIFTMYTQDLPQRDIHQGITALNLEYTTPLSDTITST